jgi:hypothetical protein
MTKISGIPEELRALAQALADVAPDLQKTASRLSSVSLPEMPPAVAGVVSDTLGDVGSRLRSAAMTVEREGLAVGKRATWLAIAGQGGRLMDVYPPRPRFPWDEPQLPDFGPVRGPEGPDLPDYGPIPGFPEEPEGFPLPDFGDGPRGFPIPELPDGPLPFPLPGIGGGPIPFPGPHPGDDGPGHGLPGPFGLPFPNIVSSDDGGEGEGGQAEGGGSEGGDGEDEPLFIPIPVGRWPTADETVEQGEAEGNEADGTVDREGAADRRRGRYGPEDRVPGKDIDEWPPAVIDTGKPGYTLHPAEPSDNRGMGAYIGNKLRGVPDGTHVRIGHGK